MNADMKQIKKALETVKGIAFYYDPNIGRFVVVCGKQYGVTVWQNVMLDAISTKKLEGHPLVSWSEWQAKTGMAVFTVRS